MNSHVNSHIHEYSGFISTKFQKHNLRFAMDFRGEQWWVTEDICHVLGISADHAISALIANDQRIRTHNNKKLTDRYGIRALTKTNAAIQIFVIGSGNVIGGRDVTIETQIRKVANA